MKQSESPLEMFRKSAGGDKASASSDSKKSDPKLNASKTSSEVREAKAEEPPLALPITNQNQIRTMMNRMHAMRNDIENQLDKVVQLSGYTQKEILDLLENQHNFPKEMWDALQKKYREFESDVWGAINLNPSSSNQANTALQMGNSSTRKGKFSGGARRRWISTR